MGSGFRLGSGLRFGVRVKVWGQGWGLALLLARLLDLGVLGAAVLDLTARPTVEPVSAHLTWVGLGVRFGLDLLVGVGVSGQDFRLGLGLGLR